MVTGGRKEVQSNSQDVGVVKITDIHQATTQTETIIHQKISVGAGVVPSVVPLIEAGTEVEKVGTIFEGVFNKDKATVEEQDLFLSGKTGHQITNDTARKWLKKLDKPTREARRLKKEVERKEKLILVQRVHDILSSSSVREIKETHEAKLLTETLAKTRNEAKRQKWLKKHENKEVKRQIRLEQQAAKKARTLELENNRKINREVNGVRAELRKTEERLGKRIGNVKTQVGPAGVDGAPGLPGKEGKDGAIGATGLQGHMGEKGDKGDAGVQGLKGEKGDKGDKGEQGKNRRNIKYIIGAYVLGGVALATAATALIVEFNHSHKTTVNIGNAQPSGYSQDKGQSTTENNITINKDGKQIYP